MANGKKNIYNEITNTFLYIHIYMYIEMSIKQRPKCIVGVSIMFIYAYR